MAVKLLASVFHRIRKARDRETRFARPNSPAVMGTGWRWQKVAAKSMDEISEALRAGVSPRAVALVCSKAAAAFRDSRRLNDAERECAIELGLLHGDDATAEHSAADDPPTEQSTDPQRDRWAHFTVDDLADDIDDAPKRWWFYGWLDGGDPIAERAGPEAEEDVPEHRQAYSAGLQARLRNPPPEQSTPKGAPRARPATVALALATSWKRPVYHRAGCRCGVGCEACGATKNEHHQCKVCNKFVGPCAFVAKLSACRWCISSAAAELDGADAKAGGNG